MISNILLVAGLGLFLISLALLMLIINEHRTRRQRLIEEHHQSLGLPPGKLVYENTDKHGEPITSDQFQLAGMPDFIVELEDGNMVPVEHNSTIYNAAKPLSNHEVLIGSYCLILEEYMELPPTHGILQYADREFTVEYTPTLRRKVIRLLKAMQACSEEEPPGLNRQKAEKCRSCVFKPICPVGRSK
jgi:CRISPR-associated exonuclease Cas4